MRSIVNILIVVSVLACATSNAEELKITHGPYLQHPAPDAITVVWHTNKACVSKVEYGIGNELTNSAISSHYGLIDNNRTSHIIRLTGLKPATTYSYRVESREFVKYIQQHIVTWGETVTGKRHQFTTFDPEKKSFSFSVVADNHERASELEAMMKEKSWQGVDFAVYNGDVIGDFMKPDQMFTGFIDVSVEGFAKNKPFIFVRGNHDIRGRYARNIADFIPSFGGRAYFSFNHGSTHFIVLDSGEDKTDSHEYYNGLVDYDNYLKEQAEWLRKDLDGPACRNAKYKIVFCHIPLRGSRGYSTARAQQNFEPLLNAAKVDLVLSGHTHRMSHVPPEQGKNGYHQIISPPHATMRVDITEKYLNATITKVGGEVLMTRSIIGPNE